MVDIDNERMLIDSREIEERIIKLKRELEVLTKLGNDYIKIPGETADWMEGITLVRDTSFPEYTKSAATDNLGSLSLNVWPLSFINWEDAACALQKKYVSIDYDGVKYWVKKPI